MKNKLIYLAVPYSNNNPTIEESRFKEVNLAAAHFFRAGLQIFSPISHCHPIKTDIGGSFEIWGKFCIEMLSKCDELYVLTMPGWRESKGVSEEIKFSLNNNIPVTYIEWRSENPTYAKVYLTELNNKNIQNLNCGSNEPFTISEFKKKLNKLPNDSVDGTPIKVYLKYGDNKYPFKNMHFSMDKFESEKDELIFSI